MGLTDESVAFRNGAMRVEWLLESLNKREVPSLVCAKKGFEGSRSGQGLGIFPPATGFYPNIRTIFVTSLQYLIRLFRF